MADEMQFDLVSPERSLASQKVTSVQIPGADGDMTAMADHAPTITTLRPGVLRVDGAGATAEYVVTGGFAQINSDGVTVLAERAIARTDMTQELLDAMIAEAASVHKAAKEAKEPAQGMLDDAAKLVADMVAMGSEIGLSASQPNL
ncbi:F0F1 ATP synthase subunit epsilon [Marinovum sp. 2_MG-2023]|uniref:F0F1 ATP synthase subunit epsilon n=1 Tax=unclassified Marinovum TaxID=2647166 RepID=UPI0026E1E457|nr:MULTISPECIES: F0F1 ATP synthase subunit epsilon [unclassified Marinovum]MDO6728570.1 F0F1 ATP synthase subunit epsilon [Marinovum sp. 2_MG-2023]MDO6778014.1 F0F1 ATP synthase subunit epsilon [Marinovum sp. 1_MG-2023]